MRDTSHPVVFAISPSSASPGDSVNCTITMDALSGADQDVSLNPSSATAFSNLPSEVTVAAGSLSVTFAARVGPNASGQATITASANGESAVSNVLLIVPG